MGERAKRGVVYLMYRCFGHWLNLTSNCACETQRAVLLFNKHVIAWYFLVRDGSSCFKRQKAAAARRRRAVSGATLPRQLACGASRWWLPCRLHRARHFQRWCLPPARGAGAKDRDAAPDHRKRAADHGDARVAQERVAGRAFSARAAVDLGLVRGPRWHAIASCFSDEYLRCAGREKRSVTPRGLALVRGQCAATER
jgi:hypothetical protein